VGKSAQANVGTHELKILWNYRVQARPTKKLEVVARVARWFVFKPETPLGVNF
jgi:hypothetical protein